MAARRRPDHVADAAVDLGDGLVLRRATDADVEAIVGLQTAAFGDSDGPGVRAHLVGPGAAVGDWTVVADRSGRVVASSALLDHVLELDGTAVPVGQIEYVATDPAFRRRGLVRRQIERHHDEAARRGALATIIGGIPYFYRRFGYGYGLDHPALYRPDRARLAPDPAVRVRAATDADVAALRALDEALRPADAVVARRDDVTWRNHLAACTPEAWVQLVVAERDGALVGAAGLSVLAPEGELELVPSMAADDGVTDALVARLVDEAGRRGLRPIAYDVAGTAHGARIVATGTEVPYGLGLYVRVPDPARLLDELRPTLSRRLAASRFADLEATIHLSLYDTGVELLLADGAVHAVRPAPGIEDPFDQLGVGIAPDWVGALVFGRWGAIGLADRVDDVTLGRHAELLEVLFPRLVADVIGVL
ncbi:MAG: GNAT family N-acetyltransferase [Acidimicrobiales bacterium]